MPEQLTPPQQAMATRVDTFVSETLLPLAERHADQPERLRHAVIAAAREQGLYGLAQPRSHGGLEADTVTLTLVRERLAASGLAARRHVLGPGPGFLSSTSGRLAEDYLEPLLRGEKRTAFAFTDAREGPVTSARRAAGGWYLSGCKSYVSGGAEADFFGVVARLEDNTGSLMAIVDAQAQGVHRSQPFRSLDGSHHVVLHLDDTFIPDDALVGAPGEGMPRAMRQIGDVRLAVAAEACGLMICTLEGLEQHLLGAHRSGEPLAKREGVRLRFAETRIEAYAARSMVYRTARLADCGENVINEGMASKVFATEALGRIVDTAVQLAGGDALVEGHLFERLYREARSLRLAEGASDVLRLNLARGRFELGKGRV